MRRPTQFLVGACALAVPLCFVACDDDEATPPLDAGASDAAVFGCLEVTDDIRADTVWSKRAHGADAEDAADEPDVCVRREVVVQGGARLVVEPGVRVAFDPSTSLVVARAGGASLSVDGSTEEPIVFTGAVRSPGSWGGVEIRSDDPRNRLAHVSVIYGGGGGAVAADDTFGRAPGALVLNAEPGAPARAEIRDVTIEDSAGWGLIVEGISEATGLVTNRFARNALGAILLSPRNVSRMDATTSYEGNGFDGVAITGEPDLEAPGPTEWRPLAPGARYWVREPIRVLSDLTIAAGTEMIFAANTGLSFPQNTTNTRAELAILGTADAKVRLLGEQATAGSWTGLDVETGRSNNRVQHAIIAHAKTGMRLHRAGAFPPAVLRVSNTDLQDNETCAVESTSPENTLTLTDVAYARNGADFCAPD